MVPVFCTMSATSSISSDVAIAAKRELAAAFAPRRSTASTRIDNHFSLAVPGHDDLFLLNRYGPIGRRSPSDDILTIDLEVASSTAKASGNLGVHDPRGCHQARPSPAPCSTPTAVRHRALSLTVGGFDSKFSQNRVLP